MSNVPELRFSEFASTGSAQVLGEWEEKYLSDVLVSVDAGWSPACKECVANENEWGVLKTTAVVWGGYDDTQNKALPSHLKERPKLEAKEGDILITRAGPLNRVAVVVYVSKTRSKVMISDKIMRVRTDEVSSPDFISRLLGTSKIQNYFSARKSGLAEAQANISQTILRKTPISIPPLPEQQKIATFLSAVDKKLGHLRRKHELLESYKRGIMQKIFSPFDSAQGKPLRFKQDNGADFPNWEEKRLGDVVSINPKPESLPEEFVYIDLESVKKGHFYPSSKILLKEAPSRAQRLLNNGDVLFQMVRPYQRNNLFFDKQGNYVASTGYAQLRAKSSLFIFQLIHTDNFVNKVLARCTGTSYPAINSNDLGKISVVIPTSEEEQQKIANFLSTLDKKLEAVQKQIDQTEVFKKGLLQKMFV